MYNRALFPWVNAFAREYASTCLLSERVDSARAILHLQDLDSRHLVAVLCSPSRSRRFSPEMLIHQLTAGSFVQSASPHPFRVEFRSS